MISFTAPSSAVLVSRWALGAVMRAGLCGSSVALSIGAQHLLFSQALLPEDLRPVIALALVPWEEVERPSAAGGFLLLRLGPGSAAAPQAGCRMLPMGSTILSYLR